MPAVPGEGEGVGGHGGPLGSCGAQAAPLQLNKQILSPVNCQCSEQCGGKAVAVQCSVAAGAACIWGWNATTRPATRRDPRLRPRSSWVFAPTQVKSVNLSDGEVLSIRGVDGDALVVLANQTLLVEGQVIRSPTNTISVYFRTFQDEVVGTFQLHYQGGYLPNVGAPGGVGWRISPARLSPTGLQGWKDTRLCPCRPAGLLFRCVPVLRTLAGAGGAAACVAPWAEGSMRTDVPDTSAGCAPHTRLACFCPRAVAFPAQTQTASLFFSLKSYKKKMSSSKFFLK